MLQRWICQTTTNVMGRVWVLAVYLLVANSAAPQPVYASFDEVYHYREVNGNILKEVTWRLTKTNHYTLIYTSPGEKHVTITDKTYNTLSWQVITDDGQTDLMATRADDVISIEGRFKGKPVKKRLEIDGCPWYQATSLSLRGLINSGDQKRLFWTIRFETLTVHKVKAIKKEVEHRDPDDRLLHIRLTLPGLLAPFWKSDYWFGLPEGVFFRFRGPSGPPGSPEITITRMVG